MDATPRAVASKMDIRCSQSSVAKPETRSPESTHHELAMHQKHLKLGSFIVYTTSSVREGYFPIATTTFYALCAYGEA
jgi:hypothetical protein